MSYNTVYVLTGGNRGLGLGFLKQLLQRPNTTVIVTVRNASAAETLASDNISLGPNSVYHVAILDLTTSPSPSEVQAAITEAAGSPLERIDVLINNAAVCPPLVPAAQTSAEDLRAAYETNTIAPLMVFQALWPLLQKATFPPKLIMVTSSVGSISAQEPLPGGAYGPSKAALNWLTRSLHAEHEGDGLIAVALHPGWVQTRAGDIAATSWNYAARPPDTVEKSVEGMLKMIDTATRESVSGKFITQTGEEIPW
ncbi:hypothetical protein Q7P37_010275 [Cladosporium fusiforme]